MQPDFQILANRQDVTERFRPRLLSLRIIDEAGLQSDTVEIQLDDRDNGIEWPSLGAELEVSLGYRQTTLTRMGLYRVDEVEHREPPNTITVRGKAADMRSSVKAPKTRQWENIAIQDLVTTMAEEHQLKGRVSKNLANIVIPQVDQTEESDLHLLTRIARQYDALSKPTGGFWVFVVRGEAKATSGQGLPVVLLKKHEVIEHRLTQVERHKYTSVRAHWHDASTSERVTVMAGEGRPTYVIRHTYPDAQQALNAAQAKLKRLQRGVGSLSLTLMGRPDLQVEGKIQLSGFREVLDQDWLVTRVEHQLNSSGFISRLETEIPNL